jgi:two-component system nitrogen regulation sensor histidine kinase NtrY
VTLAQRLLVALFVLTIATTGTLAFLVREAWRHAEEGRFDDQFQSAMAGLDVELRDVVDLPALLAQLCDHDPVVDSALVDLRTDQLDQGRRLALSVRVPELMRALRLSDLVLVTDRGEILGAGEKGRVGSHDARLAARIRGDARKLRRTANGPPAIEAHCTRSSGGITLGLVGTVRLDSVFARVGASQGLMLSLDPPSPAAATPKLLVGRASVPQLPGTPIYAARSRLPLAETLGRLDAQIFALGGATFAAALVVAFLLSRGLSRPIVRLSEQARRVVTGEPLPVKGSGVRELEELALAFNQTIADLVSMRKRLAATERIAARREIARRVAHEIKNPLAPIRAAVETLRRLRARSDPAFDEYFDEATRTVLGEVSRISNIVQEFTRFARLPAPRPEEMDAAETIRGVVTLHATSDVPIEFEASSVPRIVADRDQIVQIATNLIQNALDAVRETPNPRVVVSLLPRDPAHVAIVVRDNGPGVPRDRLPRLFEAYATTKEHGTGLGLAIVERIAVEHGGEVTYRDAPGGGAEFTVVLPVTGPTLLPEAPPESARSSGDPADS